MSSSGCSSTTSIVLGSRTARPRSERVRHLVATLIATCLLLGACGGGGSGSSNQNFATCGNGRLDSGERCDDGNLDDSDACNTACQPAHCGDGVVYVGVEDCDGRNLNGGTCVSVGRMGTPVCDAGCHYDYSVCGPPLPTATETFTPAPPTSTATPSVTPTPTRVSMCGDGLLGLDETCDSCAADCMPLPCPSSAASGSSDVQVSLSLPASVSPVVISLAYRTSVVSLPDIGLATRVKGAPGLTVRAPTDSGYALNVPVARLGGIASGVVFTATFDRCSGASPTSGDFACTVTNCGTVSGCTCSAAVVR
jgi:cysteine-rich repeat protein